MAFGLYYCVEDIKGFTVGKGYHTHELSKQPQTCDVYDFDRNSGTYYRDKYQVRPLWDGYEDMDDYNYRVSAINGYLKKRKKSANTKKRRKKPLIDLLDNNGHIKSLREGQIKRYFTPIKSEVEALIRDRKLNKLVK